ncbi:MAG: amino acid permease [Candidatus Nealsonbacteria bacterium]|nr:amino acid permease [Candidatus Nealsonbacteria bacterium]
MDLIKSIAVFLGTVIGVGIFSLPFIAMKAGFFVAVIYLLIMAFISYKIHDFYAEVVLSTNGNHRLPGYAEKYLGRNWKIFSFIVTATSFVCALLAYLIVGGQFLFNALSSYLGGGSIIYLFIFFILGAFLIFREIKMISKMELALLIIIILILLLIFIAALPHINNLNLLTFNNSYLFLPYGAIVFSLWGASIIPELKEMTVKRNKPEVKKILKKTIFWGIAVSSLAYFIFIFSVLGVSGNGTSDEAILGLKAFLGTGIVRISSIFGFLCCFTSYITIGLTLKKSLQYDFKVLGFFSWVITAFVPLLLYLLGAREFIKIIGFAGTITIGFEALLIILIYRMCLKAKVSISGKIISYGLAIVFGLGILLEVGYFLV